MVRAAGGETSSGKSTWIDTLLGAPVLPASPEPTTAAPVEVRFADTSVPGYSAVKPGGIITHLDPVQFEWLCRQPQGIECLRLTWPLERVPSALVACRDLLRGLVLVDAPGYNSCVREHTEVLTRVLPEADGVMFLVNDRRGLTDQDAGFLDLVCQGQADGASLFLAVNWLPGSGGQRRLAEIRSRAVGLLGREVSLYPLQASHSPGATGRPWHRIWSADLWQKLEWLALSPERQALIEERLLTLAGTVLTELSRTLAGRLAVVTAQDNAIQAVQQQIARSREQQQRALELADSGRRELLAAVDEVHACICPECLREVDEEVGSSGRWTESRACAAYVKEALLPRYVRRCQTRLEERLVEMGERLAAQLDVCVPVTSLCPYSRAISAYGTHNQRGYVSSEVRPARLPGHEPALVWIEELGAVAEGSGK